MHSIPQRAEAGHLSYYMLYCTYSMRRRQSQKVIIKEPPIKSLSKGRSCLKRTCLGGCVSLAAVIVAAVLFIRFVLGPDTKELKDLPAVFTDAVPLYDSAGIAVIKVTRGKDRARNLELAAYLPKLAVSPAVLWLEREKLKDPDSYWVRWVAFMKEPVGDHRDLVELEWRGLAASPDFIADFYKTELKKKGFSPGIESSGNGARQFTFENVGIQGAVFIKKGGEKFGTELIKLSVRIELPS